MNHALIQWASMALHGIAGSSLFIVLMNRFLIRMPGRAAKVIACAAAAALLIGGALAAGFLRPGPPWTHIPAGLLILILLGEARRLRIRRLCAGSPPVNSIPHHTPLTAPVTTTDVVVHRYEVPLPAWRGPPLRIAHLTDLHVHPSFPLEYYRDVLATAEAMKPDLAVFTGDFISDTAAVPRLREVLRPIARLKTYAVLGNHDYWTDADAVRRALVDGGLHVLSDHPDTLAIGGLPVTVSGCDHPWSAHPRPRAPRPPGDALHLVLTHTPDNIYHLAKHDVDLVFAGHCHAGQIRLPVLGAIVVPSAYGRRFDHGHFVVNGTHLFVASGIGAAGPPVRIYCQPDIFIVDVIPSPTGAPS